MTPAIERLSAHLRECEQCSGTLDPLRACATGQRIIREETGLEPKRAREPDEVAADGTLRRGRP